MKRPTSKYRAYSVRFDADGSVTEVGRSHPGRAGERYYEVDNNAGPLLYPSVCHVMAKSEEQAIEIARERNKQSKLNDELLTQRLFN